MDKTLIIVSAVVGSLGVLSAILGFSAEGTKLTPSDIIVYGDECIYPQNPALALGVCSAIFLLVAQITISAVGGCCGCCKSRAIPSETKRIVGIVCAVSSWIAAVIAWVLLVAGAAWNANVSRDTAPECYYLKDGIFAGAAVLTLAATALGITSYVMLPRQPADAAAAAASAPNKPGEQLPPAGIALGHPQIPPPKYPQCPAQPQGYEQAQFQPPTAPPQGYGSHAPNHQFHPPQGYAQV
ncbi:uncharacterized protein LOC133885361 [Phragmites australis]|uniref:uncharacterized protein LOC133885361 n=1 Tax=Phragmites australis TaxID=29695 RepID=UPI002D773839|nr:uncharacterized protein LOC133885361 [Phragmites australis]